MIPTVTIRNEYSKPIATNEFDKKETKEACPL